MKKPEISGDEAERILMALDQVSQTIDVMTGVVDRLKRHVNQTLEDGTRRGQDNRTCAAERCATKRRALH